MDGSEAIDLPPLGEERDVDYQAMASGDCGQISFPIRKDLFEFCGAHHAKKEGDIAKGGGLKDDVWNQCVVAIDAAVRRCSEIGS